jgi:hypothetical protein
MRIFSLSFSLSFSLFVVCLGDVRECDSACLESKSLGPPLLRLVKSHSGGAIITVDTIFFVIIRCVQIIILENGKEKKRRGKRLCRDSYFGQLAAWFSLARCSGLWSYAGQAAFVAHPHVQGICLFLLQTHTVDISKKEGRRIKKKKRKEGRRKKDG